LIETSSIPVQFQREHTDALIRERFNSSFMSDAKWVRLLEALVSVRALFEFCKVKLVWDESTRDMWIPSSSSFGFSYYRSSMEGMISGTPRGFYKYKEVEWIDLSTEGENAESIVLKLKAVGHFELERRDKGIKLYAYR